MPHEAAFRTGLAEPRRAVMSLNNQGAFDEYSLLILAGTEKPD
jgi:hypothetical protein